MMKKLGFLVLLFSISVTFAQKSINNYKYIIVPIQFEFLSGHDQYRTSSLTKYLFNQLGIEAYFDVQELPDALFKDRCKALYADVNKVKGGFLRTNIQIELKDCMGAVIATSEIGSTKEKEFKIAYNEAIKEAFKSFEFLGYNYEPLEDEKGEDDGLSANTQSKEAEINRLKSEIEELKKEKEESPVNKEVKTNTNGKVISTVEADIKDAERNISDNLKELLYAQAIEGGYQLIDSEPKKVMILLNTAAPNVYTVKGKDAIVFEKDGQWIYSENNGTAKTEKILNIKF